MVALRDGTIENYCTPQERGYKYHSEIAEMDWVRTEGHLDRLWKMAEDAAKM